MPQEIKETTKGKPKIRKCWNCGSVFLKTYTPKATEVLELGTVYLCARCNYPWDEKNLIKIERYSQIIGNEIYTNITLSELRKQIEKNN